MSATSLTHEMALLVDAFGYDLEDLESFQFNAAAGAFLPVEEREELVELIAEGHHWKAPAPPDLATYREWSSLERR